MARSGIIPTANHWLPITTLQLASPRIRGDYAVPKRRHLAAQDAAAHAGSGGSSSRRS